MKEDRRKYPRLRIPLEVEYQVEGDRLCQQATLIDLSAGGVAMMTEDPLPAGGQLAFVRFKLDEVDGETSVIEAETEVVRCIKREGIGRRMEYLVGVRFTDLSEEDFSNLETFVDQRLAKAAAQSPATSRRVHCERPITIQYRRFDEFVNEVATNLSLTGMFIRAKRPRPPGSTLDFSFQLGEDFNLIHGQAEVVWTRPLAEGPDRPAGMGIRFLELDEVSQRVLEQILEKGMGQEPEDGAAAGAGGEAAPMDDDSAVRIAELEAEHEDLSARFAKARVEFDAERETLSAQLAQTRAELEQAGGALEESKLRRQHAAAEIARLTSLVQAHQQEAQRISTEAGKQAADLQFAVARLGEVEKEGKAASSRAAGLDSKLLTAQKRITKLEDELATVRQEQGGGDNAREELQALVAELESEREQLRLRVEEHDAGLERLRGQHAESDQARQGHEAEIEQLRQEHQAEIERLGRERHDEIERLRGEREELRLQLRGLQEHRGVAHEDLEQHRQDTAERIGDLERRLEAAGREAEAREEKFDQLGQALVEAETLAEELERANTAREEAEREIDGLKAAINQQGEEAAARGRELESRISEAVAEAELVRARLEDMAGEKRNVREDLERTEHERAQMAAKFERLSYQMQELQRESDARQRAHHDKLAAREARAEENRREVESQALELEHQIELANQENGQLRAEVERLGHARDELSARIERLVQEADELRDEAAAHDNALRDEIGALEDRITQLTGESERAARHEDTLGELRGELATRQDNEDRLGLELEQAVDREQQLRTELAAASSVETELRDELGALRAEVDAARERHVNLEAKLAERTAASERVASQNRELEAQRTGLAGRQEELEEELATAAKKLSNVVSMRGRDAPPPAAVRRGSLRAAALVGFGLVLGFIASYPFETLLVSADPIAIPTTRPAIEIATQRPAEAPAAVAEDTPAAPNTAPAPPSQAERPPPLGTVERWAAAWSDQRVADYLGAYATMFQVPDGLDRRTWELERTDRVSRPESIEVTLDGFELVTATPDSATVRFRQAYVAGAYRDRVSKTLDLVWEDDDWRIARETSVELD